MQKILHVYIESLACTYTLINVAVHKTCQAESSGAYML